MASFMDMPEGDEEYFNNLGKGDPLVDWEAAYERLFEISVLIPESTFPQTESLIAEAIKLIANKLHDLDLYHRK